MLFSLAGGNMILKIVIGLLAGGGAGFALTLLSRGGNS
jgi:hypothetical protein